MSSSSNGKPSRRLKVAMYSHDAMGLGHMRRNLLIAHALRSRLGATVLMIAGAWEAGLFELPSGVDCLTLPALRKDSDGRYESKRLDVSLDELIGLRGRTIDATLCAFEPDLFVVDKVPRGIGGELTDVLERLRRSGRRTRCVLGLRDILDEASSVRREWREEGNEEAIARWYDAVWVYGDRSIYDAVEEYGWSPRVAAKVRYTGYLDRRPAPGAPAERADVIESLRLPPGRLAVCMVGGGQDGAAVAEAFAGASLPDGMNGVIVTGPFMPTGVRRQLLHLAAGSERLRVVEFMGDTSALLSAAERVVTMGGYNAVCEVLSYRLPALIVPRVRPRSEQWVRAERFAGMGLVDVLHPDHLDAEGVSAWLASDLKPAWEPVGRMDFGGLGRLPEMVAELCGTSPVSLTIAPPSASAPAMTKVGHAIG
jgi:predicted glycosyltransferase